MGSTRSPNRCAAWFPRFARRRVSLALDRITVPSNSMCHPGPLLQGKPEPVDFHWAVLSLRAEGDIRQNSPSVQFEASAAQVVLCRVEFKELMPHLDTLEQHLFQLKEIELIVLKGHLIFEEGLNEFLACFVNDIERLLKIGFPFERKVALLSCLVPKQMANDEIWEQLREINRLRNKLAHNLRFSQYEGQLKQWATEVLGYNPKTIKRTLTYRNSVVKAFVLLSGKLTGLSAGYAASGKINSNFALQTDR